MFTELVINSPKTGIARFRN